MGSIFWSPVAVMACLFLQLAVLASTMEDANICAVSGLCPGDVVENVCQGSDFLPFMQSLVSAGDCRKSKPMVIGVERLAFASSSSLNPSLEHPLPKKSPDKVRDTAGGCTFTPAPWLPPCWVRPSHWEIFSLMLMTCSWEGGFPDCTPCQAIAGPFCRRSIWPPPRLPCSSLRASMMRGGKWSAHPRFSISEWFRDFLAKMAIKVHIIRYESTR